MFWRSCLAVSVIAFCSTAQPSDSLRPTFEVASVKPARTNEIGGIHTYAGGRVEFRGSTLLYLVQQAFYVQDFRISGMPGWQDERYDIDAIVPETAMSVHSRPPYSKAPLNGEQRLMLQSLLADRFGLKWHLETREGPVYLMVRGKKTLKLVDAKDKAAYPWSGGLRGGMIVGDGMAGTNESMSDLAERLSRYMGRPVLDRTGLTGSYDFRSEYSPLTGDGTGDSVGAVRPDVPSMIAVCLEDLGLKLESSKAPSEYIIVDHIDRPSPN
jgi:uncharacterized protein (TIGR03435 family)